MYRRFYVNLRCFSVGYKSQLSKATQFHLQCSDVTALVLFTAVSARVLFSFQHENPRINKCIVYHARKQYPIFAETDAQHDFIRMLARDYGEMFWLH